MIAIYGDNLGRSVTARTADPTREGKPSVRVQWQHKWCDYWPRDGDEETANMIRLCAQGQLPPEILADRIDEVEPPDPNGQFPDYTAVMRRAGVLVSLTVGPEEKVGEEE